MHRPHRYAPKQPPSYLMRQPTPVQQRPNQPNLPCTCRTIYTETCGYGCDRNARGRACAESQRVGETNVIIDRAHHFQALLDFRFNVLSSTKNVRVILRKSSNSRQPRQRASNLIPVQRRELGESKRHISVAPGCAFEQHAVAWTVHGLETKLIAAIRVIRIVTARMLVAFTASASSIRESEHVGLIMLVPTREGYTRNISI